MQQLIVNHQVSSEQSSDKDVLFKQAMKHTVNFSKNAVNVFFHILTGCNLSCTHCYINPEQHGRETLSLAVIEKWLGAFIRRGVNTNLIFLGGEPTLHPDLAAAAKAARKIGFESITIDTNGFLFHDILEKVSPQEVDFFSFSLDGATRKTNDLLRGDGCYDNCIAGIRKAVTKGFHTSLIYTVSSANLDELKDMPPLLSELGIDRFFIQVLGLRGKSAGSQDIRQVPRNRWLSTVPSVAEKISSTGIIVSYPKVFLESDERFECAGRVADNYFVFPNGRVYRCPLCEDYPLHSLQFVDDELTSTAPINESDLFCLDIPEGCVMNKLIQPGNLSYLADGLPAYRIACCLLKEEVLPA